MLAVKNIGKFGESILICQNFTYQSFTVHMILSELKAGIGFCKSVNLAIKVSELEFFNHDANFKVL